VTRPLGGRCVGPLCHSSCPLPCAHHIHDSNQDVGQIADTTTGGKAGQRDTIYGVNKPIQMKAEVQL
jgi:hypothetical protein